MATILLRSPYYETHSQAYVSPNVAKSATLTLSVDGTQISSMSKDTVLSGTSGQETGTVAFEIADLCRDYLNVTFNNSYTSQSIAITGTLTFKSETVDDINTGSAPSTVGNAISISHTGLDGYYEFMEGLGTGQNSAKTVANFDVLQDNTDLYYPYNTSGVIPYWSGSAIVYDTFPATDPVPNNTQTEKKTVVNTVFKIHRFCSRYEAYKVTFVNKYGALQDLYFSGKTIENINVSKTTFKRNIANSSFEYDKQKHSIRQFNALANETIILNSPPMSYDNVNEAIKQLLVSEQVWIRKEEGGSTQTVPINITDTQQTFKTGLNDKIVQYTITAEYAFDMISNIR